MRANKIFFFLAILNFFDGVATYFGLQSSIIEESNPLMLMVYNADPFFFLVFKTSFSLIVLLFMFIDRLKNSTWVVGLAAAASLFYSVIAVLHVFWIGSCFT